VTWQVVATKDFRDAVRSRWLWAVSGFFLTFLAGSTALFYLYLASGSGATSASLFGLFASGILSVSYTGLLAFAVAFIALITSYSSVVGERESGTLKLLLSLPHSRLDLVAGKLAGRSAVVALPVVVGFLVAALVMVATGTRVALGTFVPQVALTALLGVAFVALGVGVSAGAKSNRRATLSALGLYFVFSLLWTLVAQGVPTLVSEASKAVGGDALGTAASVKLRLFVKFLNPLRAYETLVAEVYFAADSGAGAGGGLPADVQARLVKEGLFQRQAAAQALGESLPVYLTGEFVLAVLLAWVVVPPVVGYLAFAESDL
jgi:ABC-2 type transport system permease protein